MSPTSRSLEALHGGLGGAVVTGGASIIVMIFVRGMGGAALPWELMVLVVIAAAAIGGFIQRTVVGAGGGLAGHVVQPKGDTTPYTTTFSHIETMEIRGDFDDATLAWADACAREPGNALAHVKAADFHLRQRKDAHTALGLYREVRDMPTANRELMRYAQAKVVDIYLGPLKDHGRALVELRRMIESFPGTREAEEARQAIVRIKAERDAER